MGINGDFFGNLGRMQTGLKKPRLYIHHLFGLMQFTVQYCFHVICMYVPKCRDGRHRQISGRFPMSHVDLGHRSHVETSAHVDLGTIGSGLRTTWAKTPGGIQHWCPVVSKGTSTKRRPVLSRGQDRTGRASCGRPVRPKYMQWAAQASYSDVHPRDKRALSSQLQP